MEGDKRHGGGLEDTSTSEDSEYGSDEDESEEDSKDDEPLADLLPLNTNGGEVLRGGG